jgi:hypothetical protein
LRSNSSLLFKSSIVSIVSGGVVSNASTSNPEVFFAANSSWRSRLMVWVLVLSLTNCSRCICEIYSIACAYHSNHPPRTCIELLHTHTHTHTLSLSLSIASIKQRQLRIDILAMTRTMNVTSEPDMLACSLLAHSVTVRCDSSSMLLFGLLFSDLLMYCNKPRQDRERDRERQEGE